MTLGFHSKENYNPELRLLAIVYAQFRTGNFTMEIRGDELAAFFDAVETRRYAYTSDKEQGKLKYDEEGAWRWCMLLWFQGHIEHISTEIPMIQFLFRGDKVAHQAALDKRLRNTKKVWIHNPVKRQIMYNEKFEKLEAKHEKDPVWENT